MLLCNTEVAALHTHLKNPVFPESKLEVVSLRLPEVHGQTTLVESCKERGSCHSDATPNFINLNAQAGSLLLSHRGELLVNSTRPFPLGGCQPVYCSFLRKACTEHKCSRKDINTAINPPGHLTIKSRSIRCFEGNMSVSTLRVEG